MLVFINATNVSNDRQAIACLVTIVQGVLFLSSNFLLLEGFSNNFIEMDNMDYTFNLCLFLFFILMSGRDAVLLLQV